MVGSFRSTRKARIWTGRGLVVEPLHISTPMKTGFQGEISAAPAAASGSAGAGEAGRVCECEALQAACSRPANTKPPNHHR
ncbi:MAG: hypothetical protein AMXMBFR83_21340 [Phycisphaerae bacterium]